MSSWRRLDVLLHPGRWLFHPCPGGHRWPLPLQPSHPQSASDKLQRHQSGRTDTLWSAGGKSRLRPADVLWHDVYTLQLVVQLYEHSRLYNRLGELCKWASQAALERSSQDAYDVIRLTCSKAAVWTVDDVARLVYIKKEFIFIYLLFTLVNMWSWGMTKIRSITKLYKTLLYLFIYYMNIQNVSSSRLYYPLYNRLYKRL